jgi:hypothetical protein
MEPSPQPSATVFVGRIRYFFFGATCLAATAACFFRSSSLVLICF